MASNDHDVRVLNGLLAQLQAASDQYGKSAAAGRDPSLGFNRYTEAHDAAARELTAQVQALGGAVGAPAPDLLSQAANALALLFHAPGGGGSAADDAERIEGELMQRFDSALADDGVSGPSRDAILRAYDPVKAAHDDALQAQARLRGEG